MRKLKEIVKKSFGWAIAGLIALFTIYFLYPVMIVNIYAKQIPLSWAQDFSQMNLGEIYQVIGPPQEDVSEKDYQSWLIERWWGVSQLMIITSNCCLSTSKPDQIVYVVRVNGWYKPAYQKDLLLKNKN